MDGISKTILDRFLRTVRSRSAENSTSLSLLLKKRQYGTAIGLLRQEIDTFVRLVYLDALDDPEAARLIEALVKGKTWSRIKGGHQQRITDREMVELAQARYFWIEKAYQFGCKLIHLSDFHDYESVDPFTAISNSDKQTIIDFLRDYHGYRGNDIDLPRFIELLSKVMKKIRSKVGEYCDALEHR